MDSQQAPAFLLNLGDLPLLEHWKKLNTQQKHHLCLQLQHIDIPTLNLQRTLIHEPQTKLRTVAPLTDYSKIGNLQDKQLGQKMISQGLVGCLVIAGGEGSRLRIDGPKGICKVTKIRKKSLFQLVAEKTKAAGKQAGVNLPLAIMTSPQNHEQTLVFWKSHLWFGLDPTQVFFFKQKMLPLLDKDGNLILKSKESIAEGPDGNGGALHQFYQSGIWNDWHSQGVRYLNFILIDNPLADPFDSELLGYLKRKNSEIVIKCVARKDPEEKVGILIKENGKIAVIEYSELSNEERYALKNDHNLSHELANLSLFGFTMELVQQVAKDSELPLHKCFKPIKCLNPSEMDIQRKMPMGWKYERFIFDILPKASQVDTLIYPRELCFAPLKNFNGNDSFETVENALEKRDQQVISEITGNSCQFSPFEISSDFYYPTAALVKQWQGKSIKQGGYIESSA